MLLPYGFNHNGVLGLEANHPHGVCLGQLAHLLGDGSEQPILRHPGGDQRRYPPESRLLAGKPLELRLALGENVEQVGDLGRLPLALLAQRSLLLHQSEHAHPE